MPCWQILLIIFADFLLQDASRIFCELQALLLYDVLNFVFVQSGLLWGELGFLILALHFKGTVSRAGMGF